MGSRLRTVQSIAADCMDEVLSCFKEGARITLIIRTPDMPDADFLMTSDDLPEVAALIERREAADETLRRAAALVSSAGGRDGE